MATINMRQLDEEVIRRLKRRVSLNNRSLEDEAHHIPECAADDDLTVKHAAFLAVSDRLQRETEGRSHTPAEVLIREDRDCGPREF